MNFKFDSIIQLTEAFKTEFDCYKYLENLRWSNGIICPICGATHENATFWKLKNKITYKCSKCRERFNVKVGTIFEETRLSLRKWFMAIFLLTNHSKGISSVQLSKDLHVTQKTAWFLAHRIRRITENFRIDKKFDNPVEADETYVGGKNKNRHKDKKVPGTQGRSLEDKTPVLGIIQRKTEDSKALVLAYKIDSVSKNTLNNQIENNVEVGTKIYTDEWDGYSNLKYKFKHQFIQHSKGQYVNKNIHTNTIEGFWSIFKRMFIGIYHYMSAKHINKYLNTLAFRYNNIGLNSNQRFELLLSNCYGRLTYKRLIGK